MAVLGFNLSSTSRVPTTPLAADARWESLWGNYATGFTYRPANGGATQDSRSAVDTATAGSFNVFDSSAGSIDITGVRFANGGSVNGTPASRGSAASLDWSADGTAATLTLDRAWNTIKNAEVFSFTGASLTLANWVDTLVRLDNEFSQTVRIDGAKRGEVSTGSGNDTVWLGVDANDRGWTNHFRVSTGDGNDTVTVALSTIDYSISSFSTAAYDGRWTTSDIDTGSGDDRVTGGAGADTIRLGTGDDFVTGGGGNDRIEGGAGWDTAIYVDLRAHYEIKQVTGGWTVRDLRRDVSGDEGTDTVIDVERLVFADLVVDLVPWNDAPVARDETVTVGVGGLELFSVLGNDTDANGHLLTAQLLQGPNSGTLVLSEDGTFVYTPMQGFNGTDSFVYRAFDGDKWSAPATVTLIVPVSNRAPEAVSDAFSMAEDGILSVSAADGVLANDRDVDGDALSAMLASGPQNGTLHLAADGSFTYVPNANFFGTDSFTYSVRAGEHESAPMTVTLTVTAVNDAPSAVGESYTLPEDGTLTVPARGVLANDSDVDGDALTAVLVTGPQNGTLALAADGSFTYVPNAGFFGTDSFVYRAHDGALSGEATVTLVRPMPNQAAVAAAEGYTVAEDGVLSISAADGVLANDTDPDGDALTAVLVTGPQNGTLTLAADGSFTYVPNADFSGTDSFTYRARDAARDSAPATVTLTVTPVNDAPSAAGESYTLVNGNTITVSGQGVLANDSDVDGDTLTAVLVTGPQNGTLALAANGSFTYVPNAGFFGTDSFVYRAHDGALSHQATVTLIVPVPNRAPGAAGEAYTLGEDSVLSISLADGVLANDTDPDGDALTAVLVTGPQNGTLTLAADGSFTYVPNADFSGTDSFTYRARDAARDSAPATVTLTVTPVNDAPSAVRETYTLLEEGTLAISGPGVLANDTDPDGDALTAILGTGPQHGTLTLAADGSFTYVPNADFSGTDSFTYLAHDGALTHQATVTLHVTGTDDAVFATGETYAAVENEVLTVGLTGSLLNNDRAPDGGLSVIAGTFQTDQGGIFEVKANGTFTYRPSPNFSGTDQVTYTVRDADGDTATAVALFEIADSGNAPYHVNLDAIALSQGGYRIVGAVGDGAGTAIAAGRDINGDGIMDFAYGSPFADPFGRSSAGAVDIVFGGGAGGFRIAGALANDNAGISLAFLPDMNGDGLAEILVGADGHDAGGSGAGAAYVVWGKANGTTVDLAQVALGNGGFRITGALAGDEAGATVAHAGDVNGDGIADMIIGSRLADPNGLSSAGAAHVVFGKANSAEVRLADLGTGGFAIRGGVAGDQVGGAVSAAGDVNGDGYDDLLVGARFHDVGASNNGAAFVVFGGPGSANVELASLGTAGLRVIGEAASDNAGWSVSSLGDLNGDGLDDFIVGARNADPRFGGAGAAYVVFGREEGGDIRLADVAQGIGGFRIGGQHASDVAGGFVSFAPDMNGDGLPELLIGALGNDAGGSNAGAGYVMFGSMDGFASNLDWAAAALGGFRIIGEAAADAAGTAMAWAGDLNGDGLADLLISAPGVDLPTGNSAGAVYVVFGQAAWAYV